MNGKGSKQRKPAISHAELQRRWGHAFPKMDHSKVCYGTGCPCTYTEHHACGCVEHYQGDKRTDDRCPTHRDAA